MKRCPLSCMGVLLLMVGMPSIGASQGRVKMILPGTNLVQVERLGSSRPEEVRIGTKLDPGDVVLSGDEGGGIVITCGSSTNIYPLRGRFRFMIDVASAADCTINLLAGNLDVLAEDPTEVTAGGLDMGSVSTQYAVRVDRGPEGPTKTIVVFDGSVSVASDQGALLVAQGTSLTVAEGIEQAESAPIAQGDLAHSAIVYSTIDFVEGSQTGSISDSTETMNRLYRLHYRVLQQPENEDVRIDLAKTQLQYGAVNQAVLNLKRARVTSEDELRREGIDPAELRTGLAPEHQNFYEGIAIDAPPVERRPLEIDLELIDAGRYEEALEGLQWRVTAGVATSRDYYALSRIYLKMDQIETSVGFGKIALDLNAADAALRGDEVLEQTAIIARSAIHLVAPLVGGAPPAAADSLLDLPTVLLPLLGDYTTNGALELIEEGQLDRAVQQLLRRIREGRATSRDHFALAKAYLLQERFKDAHAHGTDALALNQEDGALSPSEFEELRIILARTNP